MSSCLSQRLAQQEATERDERVWILEQIFGFDGLDSRTARFQMRSLARDLFAILGATTGCCVCAVVGHCSPVPPSGFADDLARLTAFLISVFLMVPKKEALDGCVSPGSSPTGSI